MAFSDWGFQKDTSAPATQPKPPVAVQPSVNANNYWLFQAQQQTRQRYNMSQPLQPAVQPPPPPPKVYDFTKPAGPPQAPAQAPATPPQQLRGTYAPANYLSTATPFSTGQRPGNWSGQGTYMPQPYQTGPYPTSGMYPEVAPQASFNAWMNNPEEVRYGLVSPEAYNRSLRTSAWSRNKPGDGLGTMRRNVEPQYEGQGRYEYYTGYEGYNRSRPVRPYRIAPNEMRLAEAEALGYGQPQIPLPILPKPPGGGGGGGAGGYYNPYGGYGGGGGGGYARQPASTRWWLNDTVWNI